MTDCSTICIFAMAIILGSLFLNISTMFSNDIKNLLNTLSHEQRETYYNIAKERFLHYITGGFLGVLISTIIYLTCRYDCLCAYLIAIIIIQYVYYLMKPKSQYMIRVLKTQEQIDAWLKVNNNMRKRFIMGIAVSVVGLGLLLIR